MQASNDPFEDSALTTILTVSDMSAAKHFYLEVLGAKLFREYGGDSLVLEFLGNWILIVTSSGATDDKPGTRFEPPTDPNSISQCFTIRVKDCRASHAILSNRGAKFLTPPFDNGPETRCFFRDPDGHLFEISEYRG